MIGQRVRLAREACRLTQTELASRSGVPLGTLGDLESGRTSAPKPGVIPAIVWATSFPESFFRRDRPLPDVPDGHFRRLKRGSSKTTKQVKAQVIHLVEIVQDAEGVAKFPPVTLEPYSGALDSLDDVEGAAADARFQLGLDPDGPIRNVTRALERVGVVVVSLPFDMTDHDGYSCWPDFGLGGRPTIARSSHRPGDRERFTTSHEFGHLMLHTHRRHLGPPQAESEANRFAGAFLIPARAAKQLMRPPVTLGVLKATKQATGASLSMGARRAYDLRLINKAHFVSLMKQLSARGWRKSEPIEVPNEGTVLIGRALDSVAGSGFVSDRAERSTLPIFTFNALTG